MIELSAHPQEWYVLPTIRIFDAEIECECNHKTEEDMLGIGLHFFCFSLIIGLNL